ncbi:hypothetical protein F5876DRAFT_78710 [Lentinula aff. lateritia]|uniref:Uncharacterized protein n=1 Tax=Lentinula aff. lateritia TaxID=2804960 RepID=A0ACC1TUS3_9AGAR|nr:hypothetical protein F5876DRAFT_78710 [Lentinula aff. lateritia]
MSAISIENHSSSPGSLVATHAKHGLDASAHQTPHVSNRTDAGRKMPTQQLTETTGTQNHTMSTTDSDMSLLEDEGRHNEGTSVNDPFMTNPRPHTRYNPREDPQNMSMHATQRVNTKDHGRTNNLFPTTPPSPTITR